MNKADNMPYVDEFRKKFSENANQFDALMVEMLADNKRFLGYLNYLGIDPMDGSPTAEGIVGMRIQELQGTVAMAKKFHEDVLPQIGKMVIQDFKNLNELGIALGKENES